MVIGDYTTQSIGDYFIIQKRNPYKPTRIQWNERGILNTAQMEKNRTNHRKGVETPWLSR